MVYEAILFDCDGVLVDSEAVAGKVVYKAFQALGYPIDYTTYSATYAGSKDEEIVAILSEKYGWNLGHDFVDELNRLIDEAFLTDVLPIEGAANLVRSIQVPKGVVSNSPIERVSFSLQLLNLKDTIGSKIFTADMVQQAKPKPDVYLLAAKTIGVSPKRCIAVEDSLAGVRAAVAAEMTVIGFCGGSHIQLGHDSKLKALGASHIAYTMQEVENLLKSLL
jgi:HAD superfamily hydrolase (TIGR01509 family)